MNILNKQHIHKSEPAQCFCRKQWLLRERFLQHFVFSSFIYIIYISCIFPIGTPYNPHENPHMVGPMSPSQLLSSEWESKPGSLRYHITMPYWHPFLTLGTFGFFSESPVNMGEMIRVLFRRILEAHIYRTMTRNQNSCANLPKAFSTCTEFLQIQLLLLLDVAETLQNWCNPPIAFVMGNEFAVT